MGLEDEYMPTESENVRADDRIRPADYQSQYTLAED